MNFSTEDKIAALERIGYQVKEEPIEVLDRNHNEVQSTVLNVYLGSKLQCNWGGAGNYRVDWMFNRELEKRMLDLFKQGFK